MDRYSRAIAALGVDTMKNMLGLSILVVGLAGPKAVTVWDPEVARIEDLGANFYLNLNMLVRHSHFYLRLFLPFSF